MVSRMKITIQLPDGLVEEARKAAREDRTTLRSLVEAGLREVLARRARREPFILRDESVDGEGLQPEFQGVGWEGLRTAIYPQPEP
jgi:hypothetical protein